MNDDDMEVQDKDDGQQDTEDEEGKEPLDLTLYSVNAAGVILLAYSEPVDYISNYTETYLKGDILQAELIVNQENSDRIQSGFEYNLTASNSTYIEITLKF